VQKPADYLKRRVLMAILALSLVSSAAGWAITESVGQSSTVLRVIFGLNLVFHPVFFVITWMRLLPLRFVEFGCLLFAAGVCSACMALRLYWPAIGASIDLEPLYLWIPVIYVFAFTVLGHKAGLRLSLWILAFFVAVSLPYLAGRIDRPFVNFTIQLHMVSGVLIAAHCLSGVIEP
jgi:hypothetical protein